MIVDKITVFTKSQPRSVTQHYNRLQRRSVALGNLKMMQNYTLLPGHHFLNLLEVFLALLQLIYVVLSLLWCQ